METLPSDVCKHIAGFLDYNSRVHYNTVVGLSDQCVNRIKSFEHDLKMKVNILYDKMYKHAESSGSLYKSKTLLDVFRYINKNTSLIEYTNQPLRDMVFQKATEFNNPESFMNVRIPYCLQKLIMDECFMTLCLLEVYSFKGTARGKLHISI